MKKMIKVPFLLLFTLELSPGIRNKHDAKAISLERLVDILFLSPSNR